MSEKQKIQRFNLDEGRIWEAIEGLSPCKTTYSLEEVCEKLNEQQSDLNYLARFIGEFKVDDFKEKLRTLRTLEDKVDEQQELIEELLEENKQLRRLFEEIKRPITIDLTEEDEKELRRLLGLIDDD